MTTRTLHILVLSSVMAGAAGMAAFSADLQRGTGTIEVTAAYQSVTPAQLADMRKDYFLVNVHTPFAGAIAGTDAFIPYDETAARLKEYPADRNAKIVVYCRSGRMSEIAARVLALAGYTNVLDLSGGMIGWKAAGFTVLETPVDRRSK